MDSDLQVVTAKTIYYHLYDELDKRFNNEISENCTDINEILATKGLYGNEIKAVVSCGLAIQLPTINQLLADFNISSASEKRKYASTYPQIKMDMYSQTLSFVQLKQTMFEFIESVNNIVCF